MFKRGQEVIIINLYNLTHDGAGRIIKFMEYGENKGKWLIDIHVGLICIEEERIIPADEYWRKTYVERDRS